MHNFNSKQAYDLINIGIYIKLPLFAHIFSTNEFDATLEHGLN